MGSLQPQSQQEYKLETLEGTDLIPFPFFFSLKMTEDLSNAEGIMVNMNQP